jgi:hypothetical protein
MRLEDDRDPRSTTRRRLASGERRRRWPGRGRLYLRQPLCWLRSADVPLTTTIDTAKPPAEALAYVTDPARFGDWQQAVADGCTRGDEPFTYG